MNSTIQKRIVAINRGETPKGYKKTKWGIVPVPWECKKLKDVCEINPSRNYNIDSDVTFIGMTDVSEDGKIKNQKQIPVSTVLPGLTPFMRGDILVAKITPCFENGKGANTSSLQTEYGFGSTEFHVLRSKIHNIFLFFHTIYPDFRNKLKSEMTGTAGQKRVSSNSISNYIIPLPPLPEQEAIAEILTQQDRIIDLKQQLIGEKRKQKKYLMQTLLTGKIRLPGFKEKWKNVRLRNATERIVEQVGERDIEVLSISANIGFVNQAEKFGRQIAGAQYRKYTVLHRHDFSYNKGNSKNYPQGCIYPLEDRDIGAVPDVFISFRFKNECNYMFYKQLFLHGYLNKQLYRLINFGVRNDGLLNINEKEFYNVTIPLPPLPEQEAIAEILSTADEELSLLERELEQEKLRKKALMQLLLTGLVRVEEL